MIVRCIVCGKKFDDRLALDYNKYDFCSKKCRIEHEENGN